ncbi:MAG: type II secretion system F family protein [Deltaproteobacteria bacterium]|nr:type II secretion system F family protein [Deltaproteobacteria bacterium]
MPNWVLFGLLAIAFTFILAAGQAGYWWWISRQERQQEELLRRISGGKMDELHGPESLLREQRTDAAASALGGFGLKIQQALLSSDSSTTVTQILVQMIVAAAVGALVGFFAVGPIGLIGGFIAGYIPYMLLNWRAEARTNKLVEQLPDALDLMARAIQAGVGLSDAFRLAAEEMPPPVAIEFSRVFEEIRFGRDFREAFQGMITRNPKVFDLRLMVSSILLQRETGGNLIEILENISETIRARFTFQQKVRAMTSEAKFTAIILGSLPIFVTLVLMMSSPQYLMILFTDLRGNIILGMCAGMYLTGVSIMRDLSKVEV